MKIAVSGSHRTGKTTLVAELLELLPGFSSVDEPYYLLIEEGHVFSAMPSIEEFEKQLERSIASTSVNEGDVVFDRCPLDILAYLSVHKDNAMFDIDRWLPEVRKSVQKLDLVVFVPIEDPDRISLAASEDNIFRRRVDEEMQEIIPGDRYDFGLAAIEVSGSPRDRARLVLAHLRNGGKRF